MAVALRYLTRPINLADTAAGSEQRRVGAKPHGAAEVAGFRAFFQLVAAQPFGHQPDQWLGRRPEFGGIGILDADQAALLQQAHINLESNWTDWPQRYEYEPVLLESFMDVARFAGTCYQAAHLLYLGLTRA